MSFNVLDLGSCAGGTVAGWQRAGATVTAVDLDAKALAQNPAEHRVTGDGLAYLREHGHRFDLVHMSWPCQRWAANGLRMQWPDLVTPGRALAAEIGVPYVMENVPRAPLQDPFVLCGTMFNLTAVDDDGTLLHLQRHRSFEAPWATDGLVPDSHAHPKGVQWAGAYGGARRDKVEARTIRHGGYVPKNLDVIRALLGTPWIKTERYLFEAIPPAYTEWIGRLFLAQCAPGRTLPRTPT